MYPEIPVLRLYPIAMFSLTRYDMYLTSWFIVAKDWKSVSVMLNYEASMQWNTMLSVKTDHGK